MAANAVSEQVGHLGIDVAVDIHLHEVHVAESSTECREMASPKCSVRAFARPTPRRFGTVRHIGIGPETVRPASQLLSDSAATVRASSTMRS